jgi:hypothetical protein
VEVWVPVSFHNLPQAATGRTGMCLLIISSYAIVFVFSDRKSTAFFRNMQIFCRKKIIFSSQTGIFVRFAAIKTPK